MVARCTIHNDLQHIPLVDVFSPLHFLICYNPAASHSITSISTTTDLPPFCPSTFAGLPLKRIAGVSVREYGAVVPLGTDGSYMVYERLEPSDVRHRIAAEGGSACTHDLHRQHARHHHHHHQQQQQQQQLWHGQGRAPGDMSALQRVMHDWAAEEQVLVLEYAQE